MSKQGEVTTKHKEEIDKMIDQHSKELEDKQKDI